MEDGQVAEVAQLRRDRAGQLVVVEVELRQVGQVAQLSRDRAGELVVVEVEDGQTGEVAQLRRDLTSESLPSRSEARDPTVRHGDAFPVGDERVDAPVQHVVWIKTCFGIKQRFAIGGQQGFLAGHSNIVVAAVAASGNGKIGCGNSRKQADHKGSGNTQLD